MDRPEPIDLGRLHPDARERIAAMAEAMRTMRGPCDPNHKPHPPAADLHLLRGGTWTPNPWRP